MYRRSRICVGSLVTYVCVCGGITSLGFSVDWTSSSLSRVDLSGLSWHRSFGHLWEAAVVWAPAYSAIYLCLCLATKHRVLQYRVIFTPWKHSRVPGYPLARVTHRLTSTTQSLCHCARVYHNIHNRLLTLELREWFGDCGLRFASAVESTHIVFHRGASAGVCFLLEVTLSQPACFVGRD